MYVSRELYCTLSPKISHCCSVGSQRLSERAVSLTVEVLPRPQRELDWSSGRLLSLVASCFDRLRWSSRAAREAGSQLVSSSVGVEAEYGNVVFYVRRTRKENLLSQSSSWGDQTISERYWLLQPARSMRSKGARRLDTLGTRGRTIRVRGTRRHIRECARRR